MKNDDNLRERGFEITSRKFKKSSIIYRCLIILTIGNGLGAYAIGSIPIQWLGNICTILISIFCVSKKLLLSPSYKVLFIFFAWLVIVTIPNIFIFDYKDIMPSEATTNYFLFVALRFLSILSFAAIISIVFYLSIKGYNNQIKEMVVYLGVIISIGALYIYIAQLLGLPEPFRSRIGTGGEQQATTFEYYFFHRAMGTFREPSMLAEWLLLPFFLSFISRKRMMIPSIIIGAIILLTGSLTGIVSIILGLIISIVISNPFKTFNIKVLLNLIFASFIGIMIFNFIVGTVAGINVSIIDVVSGRISPIIFEEGGMVNSNRYFVFAYITSNPVPFIGYGLGNANIVFSYYLGTNISQAFLSLYFNILYSSGIVGFVLLMVFLLIPINVKRLWRNKNPHLFYLLAAYLAWMVSFTVHSEEFTVMFGITYALFIYEMGKNRYGLEPRIMPLPCIKHSSRYMGVNSRYSREGLCGYCS